MDGNNHEGMSYDINFGESQGKSGKIPARFQQYQQRAHANKVKSPEEIHQKQLEAEERRKAYEKAKLDRIKERTEECMKIDSTVRRLGVNTNYFNNSPQENSKPLSSREAAMSVKSLAKDFSKINRGITTDAKFAKTLNHP